MRKSSIRHLGVTAFVVMGVLSGLAHAQVNVSTFHNDNSRTGQNTQETILTPSNVNSSQFGKLFSLTVDADVYAQPLYLSNVQIAGGTHNVVYVATENDTVYAIDADSGTVYASVNLIAPGGSITNSSTDLGCTDLYPTIGITGTPVIDTTTAPGTMYLVATSTVNGTVVQYLHALNVGTLAERFGQPVQIAASVAGSAIDGNGTTVPFIAKEEIQRAALLFENNHVVIGWASYCDHPTWHGWVMSYSASNLAQEGVFNASPNGSAGGIWMSDGGIAADSNGNIFFPTGNGTWNGTTDYGDSIIRLGAPSGGGFPVLDYFTPWDQGYLNTNDLDISSGGIVLLPPTSTGLNLLAAQGKQGTIMLLNQSKLGGYCINQVPACTNSDPLIPQELVGASNGVWGSPATWNGNLYWGSPSEPISAYSIDPSKGTISTSPTSQSAQAFSYPPPTPAISANGNTNGILWVLDGNIDADTCDGVKHCLGLYAFDATNLSKLLYNSRQAANNRDSPGIALKFGVPVIANGKVYVGTTNTLTVYGLFAPPTTSTALSPTFSPPGGTYTSAQSVALLDSTPGAVIYYTTNGQPPTIASSQYGTTHLSINATTTVEAMAVASGYNNSPVVSATYTISPPPSGSTVSVNLSGLDNVDGIVANGTAVPNGGLDGGGHAFSSTLLGGSLSWSGATFTLGAAGTLDAVDSQTIALPAGNYSTLSLLATGVNGNQANQSFIVTYSDGTTSTFKQSISDWFTPQNYTGEAAAATMAYRLTPTGATANGPFYLYGYAFALNSAKTVTSITLPSNRNVVVFAIDLTPTGTTTSTALSPTFSPPGGTYTSAQSVALLDSTPGAVIYYTTNGQPPTIASSQYGTTHLSINATTTVEAMAVASGYNNSPVVSATYTISPPPSGSTVSVNLSGLDNVDGIVANGTAVPNGGLDGGGHAFSSTLLGGSLSWSGATFTLGAAGTLDAVDSQTIALPAGNYSTLSLLATGVNGNQANQSFIVTYSDGTTSTFKQSISDWFTPQNYTGEAAAATMAYRLTPTGATANGPFYLYGYAFALNSAKTVTSITLPSNRNVVVFAIDLTPTGTTSPPPSGSTVSVNLSGLDNVDGIVANGTAVPNGGLDGGGHAFSSTLLGGSLSWSGATFTLGAAGTLDAVDSQTIALPAGNYSTLSLLATGVNGNQANQSFIITYSDGTTSTFKQSISDWFTPQGYTGEAAAATMAYRLTPTGATANGPFYLYGYAFALNSAKTVTSITLPSNRNVVVLAVDLSP